MIETIGILMGVMSFAGFAGAVLLARSANVQYDQRVIFSLVRHVERHRHAPRPAVSASEGEAASAETVTPRSSTGTSTGRAFDLVVST